MEEAQIPTYRVAELAREVSERAITDRHVRFYLPIAAALTSLSFMPIYTVSSASATTAMGYADGSGGPVVALALVLLLTWATVDWRKASLPVLIGLCALLLSMLLFTQSGLQQAKAHVELAPAGTGIAVLCVILLPLTVVHTVDARCLRRDNPGPRPW